MSSSEPPASPSVAWRLARLDDLGVRDVYNVFRLRQQVFVMEQACLYPDIDDIDPQAWHLLGEPASGVLWAYLRIIPPLGKYSGPAIGRVVTAPDARRHGLGRALMHEGIRQTRALYPDCALFLSAQTYLIGFYASLGFTAYGEAFDEDGIEHIEMTRASAARAE